LTVSLLSAAFQKSILGLWKRHWGGEADDTQQSKCPIWRISEAQSPLSRPKTPNPARSVSSTPKTQSVPRTQNRKPKTRVRGLSSSGRRSRRCCWRVAAVVATSASRGGRSPPHAVECLVKLLPKREGMLRDGRSVGINIQNAHTTRLDPQVAQRTTSVGGGVGFGTPPGRIGKPAQIGGGGVTCTPRACEFGGQRSLGTACASRLVGSWRSPPEACVPSCSHAALETATRTTVDTTAHRLSDS
jgi:hypothetical protein